MLFAENVRPATNDPQLKQIEQLMAPPVLPTLGIASTGSTSFDDGNSTGPFIGVASRSRNNSVITTTELIVTTNGSSRLSSDNDLRSSEATIDLHFSSLLEDRRATSH